MKRQTLAMAADQTFENYRKSTRRDEFLKTMEIIVPWTALCEVIEPHYPKVGNGRPPIGLERMLRTNGYSAISADDVGFADPMGWVDDGDGSIQESELYSLSSIGITELGLSAQTSTKTDNGNLIGWVSSYTTADGGVHDMADV